MEPPSMRLQVIFSSALLIALGCGLYPDSPLVTGTFGSTALPPGRYSGTASCNRFFQSLTRPGALDTLELPLTVEIGPGGRPVWDGSEVARDVSADLEIGLFVVERTVRNVVRERGSLTVSYEAATNIFDDLQRTVELKGDGAEVYTPDAEGRLELAMNIAMRTADPAQTGMDLAFDCRATLERE